MENHDWMGVAFFAITSLLAGWNGWLTFRNNQLKATSEANKLKIEQTKRESDQRDDRTDGRVDLWVKSNLRRGSIRAVKAELARPKDANMVSITVTDPMVREAYQPLVPFLKEIRARFPDPIAFTEKVLEDHGEWIITHICEPLGIGEYECVAMALSVSEEQTKEHRISPLPPPV